MKYREFYLKEDIDNWVINNYGEWINILNKEKYNYKAGNTDLADLLYCYGGNNYITYNNILRGFEEYSENERKENLKEIDIINKSISKFKLNDEIVVWRFTHKDFFETLFEDFKVKKENTFTEKAFMSTTLIPSLLLEFAKKNKYNCLLKLYLPRGTKGAYLKFNNTLLNEEEFLLPFGATFVLKNRYYDFRFRKWVYKCSLMSQ